MYLHKLSDHPKTVKKSIPFGLGVRAKRICEKKEEYIKERNKIKSRLKGRGYSEKMVENQLRKVDELDRKDTLKYRKKSKKLTSERVPFVLTFSRALPHVGKILNKHHNILNRSPRLRQIFKQQPLCAFRRDKNLNDIMVHQKTAKTIKENMKDNRMEKRSGKCGRNCVICDRRKIGPVKNKFGKIVQTNDGITCRTLNVIYGIHCTKCNYIVYVGETETMLKDRIQNHLSDVRGKNTVKPVSIHFNSHGHSIQNLKFVGIEISRKNNVQYRRTRESLFIKMLNTQQEGINVRK